MISRKQIEERLDELVVMPIEDPLQKLKDFINEEFENIDTRELRGFVKSVIKEKFKLREKDVQILLSEIQSAENKQKLVKELLQTTEIIEIDPVMDYKEQEGMIYTFFKGDTKYIVTSVGNVYEYEECRDKNIKLKSMSTSMSKLLPKTVAKFIQGKAKVKMSEVYSKLRNIIKKYVFLEDENIYAVLVTWIIHTYFFKLFMYVPYLWLNGDKSSGKSLILSLLSKFSFNAFSSVSVTEATLFRQVDRDSSVLLLDEYEKANAGIGEAITQILNSGFYVEVAKVSRNIIGSTGDYETKLYSTFSPKVISRNI